MDVGVHGVGRTLSSACMCAWVRVGGGMSPVYRPHCPAAPKRNPQRTLDTHTRPQLEMGDSVSVRVRVEGMIVRAKVRFTHALLIQVYSTLQLLRLIEATMRGSGGGG